MLLPGGAGQAQARGFASWLSPGGGARYAQRMQRYYPRSFPRLLLTGFALVALPLIFALINNAVTVDQLANRSQNAVYQAVQATQNGRRLAQQLNALERTARQIVILGDQSLLDNYAANRRQFEQVVAEFANLPQIGRASCRERVSRYV